MKKYLERFLIIISCMQTLLPNVCYADVLTTSESMIQFTFVGTMIILGFIIIISLVSILSLESIVKQTKLDDTASNEYKNTTMKENNSKINNNEKKIYICFLIFSFVLSCSVAIYQAENTGTFEILIFSNVILIMLSIIFREKKKNISYIIVYIAFLVIGVLPWANFIIDKKIENYNNQFLQYRERGNYGYYYYVSDIDGLITTAINNNNKNKKTISLIYNYDTYTTQSELEQLLSIIDTSSKYNIYSIEKDSNHEYIISITLNLISD